MSSSRTPATSSSATSSASPAPRRSFFPTTSSAPTWITSTCSTTTDREQLAKRIDALVRERDQLATQLKLLDPDAARGQLASGDELKLQPAPWPADPKAKGLTYQSTYFRLTSDARPELVQLAAINLEQVYAAYAHTLPPRIAAPEPTTILLAQSLADYKALVAQQGRNLFNPAYFDPAKNQIVCASDLQRMADAAGSPPPRRRQGAGRPKGQGEAAECGLQGPRAARRAGADPRRSQEDQGDPGAERGGVRPGRGGGCCSGSTTRPSTPTCPTASTRRPTARRRAGSTRAWPRSSRRPSIEVGELRVGHADRDRLDAVHAALAKGTLLPTADLLRADYKQFQVAHATRAGGVGSHLPGVVGAGLRPRLQPPAARHEGPRRLRPRPEARRRPARRLPRSRRRAAGGFRERAS